jgi:hypothetical protein
MRALTQIYEEDYAKSLILADIRQLYDKVFCIHPQSEPKATSVSTQDEVSPMKKATQSTQELKSIIIRLSWLRYFLISLRYMEVPEPSIPQTWMCPTKVTSSCDTWVFTALLWGKRYSFFLDPSTFHYKHTGLPYKRPQTLPIHIASRPEVINLDSFIIAGASNRCHNNTPGFKHQVSTKPKFFPHWHVESRSLLPPAAIPLCGPSEISATITYRVKVSALPVMLHCG